ncbi:putative truncated transcriptional regulator [Bifidobacterium longum subsp. infantis ATCC 15697 = JCM 1222 = DSM 20088]|nr:putative truncated transcriptional regulator [Bifidobacterium longum subsp. infantis ATCC 15697 = JCM 1222 = DSM 20088]
MPSGVPARKLGDEFVRRFYALVPRSGLTHDQRELVEAIIAVLRG